MSNIQRPLTLLKLPTEIRLKIWGHVFPYLHYRDGIYHIGCCFTSLVPDHAANYDKLCNCASRQFAELRICKGLRSEVEDVVSICREVLQLTTSADRM